MQDITHCRIFVYEVSTVYVFMCVCVVRYDILSNYLT